MATTTLPNHSPSPALPMLAVFAVIITAGIVISQHATQARPVEDVYSRQDVYNVLYGYAVQGNKSLCKEVIVAACPNAVDSWTGEPSPQVKAGCRINGATRETGMWLVGIIGTRYSQPVYVTGIPQTWARFQSTMLRDGCARVDASLLGGLLR